MRNLLGSDRDTLADYFIARGERSFRADQVVKWVHQQGVTDFSAMTNLSKSLRQRLASDARLEPPEVVADTQSKDGTRKWLLRLADGNCIETVFIPEPARGTLCVSSQVGCALNCTFCATARQGYNRNLESHEIIGQVWLAQRLLTAAGGQRPITNVVLMGMGEPLLNFDNVVRAVNLMIDDFAYGLSRRRVTLSTAGLVPGIDRLREECPVSLAVSLHAPEDRLRSELVPLNRKYPIRELVDACRRYVADAPRSRITFEYVMLEGVNDSIEHARQLTRLLADVPAKVNLIPFNGFQGVQYSRSAPEVIGRFRDVLLEAGLMTITRKTRGDDIDAACGQLAGRVRDRTARSRRMRDLPHGGTA